MGLKFSVTSYFTMFAHVYTYKHHHVITVYNTHDNNVVDRFIAWENRAQHETYTFNRLYTIGLVREHHTMSIHIIIKLPSYTPQTAFHLHNI